MIGVLSQDLAGKVGTGLRVRGDRIEGGVRWIHGVVDGRVTAVCLEPGE